MQTIQDWMKANLPPTCPTLMEIGAHHCEDTEWFFKAFERPVIYVWEADPRNIPVINAKQLPITLIPKACGAVDGETPFYLSGGDPHQGRRGKVGPWTLSSSVRRPKNHLIKHPTVEFVGETAVPMQRLDSYFKERGSTPFIDFIWCDVQGAEGDVVAGGHETLAGTRYFYTEYDDEELYEGQPTLARLTELVKPLGFEKVGLFSNNVLYRNVQHFRAK